LFSSSRRRPPSSPLFPYTTLFRSGPAVGEHDRGGRFGSVHLDVQPGAVGGDGGQLAGGDGRGVRPGGDVGAAAHAVTPVFSRVRSEEHTSELQSRENLVCRLLLEK